MNKNTRGSLEAITKPSASVRVFAFATVVAIAFVFISGGTLCNAKAYAEGGGASGDEPAMAPRSEQPETTNLTLAPGGADASKEEIVYAVLAADGEPEAAYVVNNFRPSAPGTFTDYGDYSKVTALSAPESVSIDGDAVTFALGDSVFSYQGDMNVPSLPWLISVSYYVDGTQLSADELAGATGSLEIRVKTSPNPDVDSAYFDNYLLQTTITLDGDRCRNVSAPDASVAAAGSDKTVAFTALPGKNADYALTADVTDFEMNGMQFAALPFSMSFDLPDADEMTGDMDELVDAVGELNDGTAKLSDGVSELDDGAEKFSDGVYEIDGGVSGLSRGSSDFNKGLKKLDEGSAGLVSGSAVIGDSLKQMSESMAPLSSGIDLSGLFALLPGFDQTPSGAAVIAQVNALNGGLSGISAGLGALSENYSAFHNGLTSYTDGVGKLSENYGKLDKSLSQLSDGVSDMAGGMSDLSKGASALAKGAAKLSDGTAELYDGVSDMPAEVEKKIDEFAEEYDKSDYTQRSFTSAKNRNVSLVQFVFRTEEIKKPDEPAPEDEKIAKPTFIDRVLSLFTKS
jgi:X-X-X-Leu-X-X-Gly heptad repeat protein